MGLKPERKYDDGDLVWSFVEVQKTAEVSWNYSVLKGLSSLLL